MDIWRCTNTFVRLEYNQFQHTFLMESLPEYKLIKSSRGGLKLLEGGYIYDKQRIHGELTHWQCEKKGVCKARLHTKEMSIMKRTNEHLHGPESA